MLIFYVILMHVSIEHLSSSESNVNESAFKRGHNNIKNKLIITVRFQMANKFIHKFI